MTPDMLGAEEHCIAESPSSRAQALDSSNPQNWFESSHVQRDDSPREPAQEDTEGMSPSRFLDEQFKDITTISPDATPENPSPVTLTISRRGPKKKKSMAPKKKAAMIKKFQLLIQNFNPIPFVPNKTLNFSAHEKLLKRFGLWDFVHTDFDFCIRGDLIAQLIAHYFPSSRCSYVNDVRLNVSRAEIAKAFSLPRKDKSGGWISSESEVGGFSEEEIRFVEDFMSNWVLLHDDTWIMPPEVVIWIKMIKEGCPEKIDWASVIWFMVEKELLQGPRLVNCYYASHLHFMMKSQREILFKEPGCEDDVKDEEGDAVIEENTAEACPKEQEGDDGGDEKMDEAGESDNLGRNLEDPLELNVGQENAERELVGDENLMESEDCKEERGPWILSKKNSRKEHTLQRCNLDQMEDLDEKILEEEGADEEQVEHEHEDQDEEEGGFHLSPKGNNLEGISSRNLFQSMETEQINFTSPLNLQPHSSEELPPSRPDPSILPGGPSSRREMEQELDISHHSINGIHKRLRTDSQWDRNPSEFYLCIEHIQNWLDKAGRIYDSKERASGEANMNQQFLLGELQQKQNLIDHLQKIRYEEMQKKQTEIYRLERELYTMGNLLNGYRRALKEKNRAFSEYAARNPQSDEPIYKDVPGTGGLVLSTMELERRRLNQEEEERIQRAAIEASIREFEAGWIGKFKQLLDGVHLLDGRLLGTEEIAKVLKGSSANRNLTGEKLITES